MGKTKSGSHCRSCWFTLLGIFPLDEELEGSENMMKQMGFTQPQEKDENKNPTIPKT
jgi:hypothetical protein